MKHVKQLHVRGCVIGVLASLTGMDYMSAREFGVPYGVSSKGTSRESLLEALRASGYESFTPVDIIRPGTQGFVEVVGPYHTKSKWHVVSFDRCGFIYDPYSAVHADLPTYMKASKHTRIRAIFETSV